MVRSPSGSVVASALAALASLSALVALGCSVPIVGTDAGPPDTGPDAGAALDAPTPPLDVAPDSGNDSSTETDASTMADGASGLDAPIAADAPPATDAPTGTDAPPRLDAPTVTDAAGRSDAPGIDRIRFDAFTAGASTIGTSSTTSHTTSGTNRLMVVAVFFDSQNPPTAATYDGDPLTYVDESLQFAAAVSSVALYYRIAPSTGTHDVVLSFAAATEQHVDVTTYTGVAQTTTGILSTQSTCDVGCISPYATPLVTMAAGSWTAAAVAGSMSAWSEGPMSMIRGGTSDRTALIDSDGPINPAGPTSLSVAAPVGGTAAWRTVMMSFAPAP